MAHERVYDPEKCEPFDVTPSKAQKLVLDHGWTRTPWTRQSVAAAEPVVVDAEADESEEQAAEPRGGRGRRRRAAEAAPVAVEDDSSDRENWRL